MPRTSERGFSLAETVVAIGVLTVGVVGAAAVLSAGMQNLSTSPADVIIAQKAVQAVEAVFSFRDSHKLPPDQIWAKLRNVRGASGSDGGIFVDGPTPLYTAGPDGLVNTTDDDSTIETMVLPGPDQLVGTGDDVRVQLTGYTREIQIRDVPNENGQLRSITVTIKYLNGQTVRTYTLTTFISSYS